jgi:hypothetical protein
VTLGGALFLTLSLAFVWGLAIYCYARVLSSPVSNAESDADEPAERD